MDYPQPTRVLIIGGGFAGLECAKTLSKVLHFEITLVDKTNHHLFQPLLYQVATSSLPATDIARSLRCIIGSAENVTVLCDEITDIKADDKQAVGASGNVYEYDKIVVCAGGVTSFFGNDHWAEHTIGLKNLGDAYKVRQTVLGNLEKAELTTDKELQRKLMTVVIVGGGPTGVELAGAFIELIQRSMRDDYKNLDVNDLRVILVEAGPRILPPFYESLATYVTGHLTDLGVEVMTSSMVTDVQAGKVIFKDQEIEAGAILWAAGIQANEITRKLPTEVDRGGRVTPKVDLSLEGYPEIFVAGDLCAMTDGAGVRVPGVAPAASQMGRHIANTLIKEYKGASVEAREPYVYWDKGSMAIVGRNSAILQYGKIKMTGFFAWGAWLLIHNLFLVGFRIKAAVIFAWAWQWFSNRPAAKAYISHEVKED